MPTIKRPPNNIQLDKDKLDSSDEISDSPKEKRIVLTRPNVSVRNPQKCDDNIIPTNEIEFIRPCSNTVIPRSHFAAGNTMAIL